MVILSIAYLGGLCAFIWTCKKCPEKWYKGSTKRKVFTHVLGIAFPLLLMGWAVASAQMENEQEVEEKEMRIMRYASLNEDLLSRLDTIGMEARTSTMYEMSSSLSSQLVTNGIAADSKIFALEVDTCGAVKKWIGFNEKLIERGNYSDSPDSIDFVACITWYYETKYYGNGKLYSSTSENAFVQVVNFNTNCIVDTLIFNGNYNPESISTSKNGRKHRLVSVDIDDIYDRLFRNNHSQ